MNEIKELIKNFPTSTNSEKKNILIKICEEVLKLWNKYVSKFGEISYMEHICGSIQILDKNLPNDAMEAVRRNNDFSNINARYAEAIIALQEDDIELPLEMKYSYFAIFNLFSKYVCGENIDDAVIINQALSSINEQ